MEGLDPNWQRLSSTEAGAYYRIDPDVLLAVPVPGFIQTAATAEASLAALDVIATEAGRKQAVIVLVNRVASQDSASRRVWSHVRPSETRVAQALVCGT